MTPVAITGSTLSYYRFNYFRPDSGRRPDSISKTQPAGMQHLKYSLEQICSAKIKKIGEKAKFRRFSTILYPAF